MLQDVRMHSQHATCNSSAGDPEGEFFWSGLEMTRTPLFQGYLECGFAAEDRAIETLTNLSGYPPLRYEDFAKKIVEWWQTSGRAVPR